MNIRELPPDTTLVLLPLSGEWRKMVVRTASSMFRALGFPYFRWLFPHQQGVLKS